MKKIITTSGGVAFMKWINKLERKYGRFGIPNLMLYVVILQLAVYVLMYFYPQNNIYNQLVLYPDLVWQGQIWRLFSYVFIPPNTSLVFLALVLYFYYFMGSRLESVWGAFRFNVYYFIGILGTSLISMLLGAYGTPIYLNLSLFLAFAWIFPNEQILLFFILPVKVKYLALIDWIFFGFTILFGSFSSRIAAITALINFFVFFGSDLYYFLKNRGKVLQNRQRFGYLKSQTKNKPMHTCTVCGITNIDDPYMDFRYCSECNGHYGYCRDHLENHEHIQ